MVIASKTGADPDRRARSLRRTAGWLLVAAGTTAALWALRDSLDKAHVALAFLLVVLAGSARDGRLVGLLLSITCFLTFNFFLLPPLYALKLADPLDWGVLLAFLVTGGIAAELLHRQRVAVELAERVEALREADRLKDALLATVSHDLRTPLTTIRAAASELRMAGMEQGELIEREADHLNTLVSDLLDLSRLRAGKLPLSIELNAAEDLVGAALERLRGVDGADEIAVQLPRDGSILVGRFDFTHSLRALTNLVENALRHSPRPGTVEILVGRDADQLRFEVSDQGSGVSKADEPHLFEPFFRSAGARPARGTGLGLAIARRVAEAQGGTVEYERREAGGSMFTLCLPAADLDAIIDS